ncbi:MAG: hypothetical protein AUH29_17315 [Candidatus Rokubacteria bacterium 13_1_40CM_69_27]|nr:MAG: hypothetical protein AUH29_17315 [Candidatus Rokubacteria bacterium 13_1_40CM_69_27]OLC38146.1 MAG: hypothetical protein AUH81_04640 [Candidatus Rokubacteria bacterium 13_1_40CM_4_69_5]
MTTQPGATTTVATTSAAPDTARLYQEGIIAGIIGAATVALWFLVIDVINGRPLYTPTVLGTALFRRGAGLGSLETLPVSMEMVLMFTWVHGLAFAAIGGVVSRLLGMAERNPNIGFGILLLFVVFEFGFTIAAMLFAAPILKVLTWPSVLVANLLAAATMAAYFWLRHPKLRVDP